MGSANGRHRRPRQAPAIVVAAGVTGSAIALPLLGAAGAHAADATTWDRVAECESGGMWSADLGNGYYGGLQFSQETWSSYGGTAYAARADLASRSQQIAVAEKVLADKGPQAWPSCAVISGLAVDGSLPGVDPGTAPSADPTQSPTTTPTGEADEKGEAEESGDRGSTGATGKPGSTGKDQESGKAGGGSAAPGPSAGSSAPPATGGTGRTGEAAGKAGTPGGSDASRSSTPDRSSGGKHRGAPAPEETGTVGGGGPRESGRHASRGEGEARDGGAVTRGGYTVQPGDSLWAIADAQGIPQGWTGLYEANRDVLGSDPDLILPGQNLDLDLGRGAGDEVGESGDKAAGQGADAPAAN